MATRRVIDLPHQGVEKASNAPGEGSAAFASILFGPAGTPAGIEAGEPPECLHDLNLDQVIEAIDGRYAEHSLLPFLWAPLADGETVGFRQEVLAELEDGEMRHRVDAFVAGMSRMRADLGEAAKSRYAEQRDAWFLQAVGCYCATVQRFAAALAAAEPVSAGLLSLAAHLDAFARTAEFIALAAEQERIAAALAAIDYTVEIKGDRVRVAPFEDEADYSAEIRASFERFRQEEARGQRSRRVRDPALNHVEAQILGLVAKLNPETFASLAAFREDNADFLDPTVERFDREVQLYLAYLDQIEPLRAAGLPFCRPRISADSKRVGVREGFDLALAGRLVEAGEPVVGNDWELAGAERIVVVSGPNQGGKTTFARAFGQAHYLARLGLSVPGREARLFLSDRIFTHFERQEDHANLRGKLEDDLVRVRGILERATPRSVVVMNESFSSTALEDARLLGRRVLERLAELDLLCVYVTFVDELATLSEKTVSMTSMVDPADPARRTFKVVRRPADGRAYAIAIAEKYRLTYARLRQRIAR